MYKKCFQSINQKNGLVTIASIASSWIMQGSKFVGFGWNYFPSNWRQACLPQFSWVINRKEKSTEKKIRKKNLSRLIGQKEEIWVWQINFRPRFCLLTRKDLPFNYIFTFSFIANGNNYVFDEWRPFFFLKLITQKNCVHKTKSQQWMNV